MQKMSVGDSFNQFFALAFKELILSPDFVVSSDAQGSLFDHLDFEFAIDRDYLALVLWEVILPFLVFRVKVWGQSHYPTDIVLVNHLPEVDPCFAKHPCGRDDEPVSILMKR